MTGKELIEMIHKNNAEDLQIMLFDQDGGIACWHYPATGLDICVIDKNDEHFSSLNGNEKVAVIQ